jgi:hypothetical protein
MLDTSLSDRLTGVKYHHKSNELPTKQNEEMENKSFDVVASESLRSKDERGLKIAGRIGKRKACRTSDSKRYQAKPSYSRHQRRRPQAVIDLTSTSPLHTRGTKHNNASPAEPRTARRKVHHICATPLLTTMCLLNNTNEGRCTANHKRRVRQDCGRRTRTRTRTRISLRPADRMALWG